MFETRISFNSLARWSFLPFSLDRRMTQRFNYLFSLCSNDFNLSISENWRDVKGEFSSYQPACSRHSVSFVFHLITENIFVARTELCENANVNFEETWWIFKLDLPLYLTLGIVSIKSSDRLNRIREKTLLTTGYGHWMKFDDRSLRKQRRYFKWSGNVWHDAQVETLLTERVERKMMMTMS